MISLLAASGCGDGRITRYPVTGQVLVKNKPIEGATVIFCPVGGDEEFQRERPYGKTDAAGNFTLTTFIKDDGAPAGEYKVMVRWTGSEASAREEDESGRRVSSGGGDRFRGRYANPERSGLTASVEPGGSNLEPFQLEPPPRR